MPTSPPVKCERMQETRAVEQCWSLVCVKPQCQLMEESEHAKTLTALADGQLQHLVQLLVGVVGREAQLVKTRQTQRVSMWLNYCWFEKENGLILHYFLCIEKKKNQIKRPKTEMILNISRRDTAKHTITELYCFQQLLKTYQWAMVLQWGFFSPLSHTVYFDSVPCMPSCCCHKKKKTH